MQRNLFAAAVAVLVASFAPVAPAQVVTEARATLTSPASLVVVKGFQCCRFWHDRHSIRRQDLPLHVRQAGRHDRVGRRWRRYTIVVVRNARCDQHAVLRNQLLSFPSFVGVTGAFSVLTAAGLTGVALQTTAEFTSFTIDCSSTEAFFAPVVSVRLSPTAQPGNNIVVGTLTFSASL